MRQALIALLTSRRWEQAIIAIIVLNSIILGLETSPAVMAGWGNWLLWADRILLTVFVIEIGARLVVHRLAFFRDPWSLFDFVVVGVALVPATGAFSVLRALRVLRVLQGP